MEQVRVFIATELPDGLREALGALQSRLKTPDQPWVKWVDPSSIHLTLKFLGNVAANRIDGIIEAMRLATTGIAAFHLEAGGLGVFPGPRRVQVAWVGLSGETAILSQLQEQIEESLARIGFTRESRPFTAHLTLARVRDRASIEDRQAFGRVITGTSVEARYAFEVAAVSLMKSQLTRGGAIYSRLGSVELKNPL